MLVIKDDHVVEDLSSGTADKSFSDGVRVGHRLHVMGTIQLLPFG
jgi:hypothetical protein